MGYASYSSVTATSYSKALHDKPAEQIFSRSFNNAMSPFEAVRESRDSELHPNSFPVILALDVTGSMGSIPDYLVKHAFPVIMDDIMKSGIADPQVLFMGIGDHECDQAPLQIGQFESSDDLLNKWLTGLWLEGGGGANAGESYSLPWYMAGKTMTDHFQKRGKKGVLITIGDEPVLKDIPRSTLDALFGGQNQDMTAAQMLELAEKTYEVFHIHLSATRAGSLQYVKDGWKQLMGDKVKFAETKESVERVIVDIIRNVFVSQSENAAPSGELDAIAAEQAAESVDPMVPGTCPGVKPSKTEEPPRIKY